MLTEKKTLRDLFLSGRTAMAHLLTDVQETPINSPQVPARTVMHYSTPLELE